jgi:hypothetical protein
MVHQLWSIESFGTHPDVKAPISGDDARALKLLEENVRFLGDRYEAPLLWKLDQPNLPNNYSVALSRFHTNDRSLKKCPVKAKSYEATINEYIMQRHARKLQEDELEGPIGLTWYVPHHAVFHPDKPGKCLVVFDGASTFRGISLNSCLLTGPDILTSLIGVLLRLRERPIAISGDIKGIFHQVRVRSVDKHVLRFLCRPPDTAGPPDVYEMQVQIFGAASSPTVCSYVLRRAAADNEEEFPGLVEKVAINGYMDNYMDSFSTEEEAIEFRNKFQYGLKKGGFHWTQWMSTSRKVLQSVPEDLRSDPKLNLNLEALPAEKTLGVTLNWQEDIFVFKVKIQTGSDTYRTILSDVCGLYDPLGFWTPVTLTARILLQDICRIKPEWDKILPESLLERWRIWVSNLHHLESVAVPRCLQPFPPTSVQLHIFVDASELGFGAVAYLLLQNKKTSTTVFVMSKSRVAPIHHLTIPRMELSAALLGAHLARTIKNELRLKIDGEVFWSDSSTVLRWINSTHCRYHTWVANRVGEILTLTTPEQRRHVPGILNPADDCSRGVEASALTENYRWWTGTDFLLQPRINWPAMPEHFAQPVDDPEINSSKWAGNVSVPTPHPLLHILQKSSSMCQLKRIIAWVLRFIHNKLKPATERRSKPYPIIPELRKAETILVRLAQREGYGAESKRLSEGKELDPGSKIATLTPFFDAEAKLIRVGGRLGYSNFPLAIKHPVLLPADNHVTKLIVNREHLLLRHATVERTVAGLHKKYWIPWSRASVNRIIKNCFDCKRHRAKPDIPLMSALPIHRLQTDPRSLIPE